MSERLPESTGQAFQAAQPPRRSFLARASAFLFGGLLVLFPFAASIVSLISPLRRSNRTTKDLRVTSLDAVPDDSIPRRFPVISNLTDAWTDYGQKPIGSVWLVRDKGSDKVLALNAICPHAGCMVGFVADKDLFVCPCHTSAFDVHGKRRLDISKVPPRDMDSLECEVRKGEVWVKFVNFQSGHAQKIPKT